MNKKELIKTISEKTGKYQKDISVVVDTLFDVIGDTLVNGEEIAIQGFGKFDVTTRVSRNVVNPRTKEIMTLPETKNVKFTQSSTLKEALAR